MSGADAAAPATRKVYVSHPPRTWVRAKALYLAGRTAGQVAAELGCSIAAVRAQASRGGWTRRDAAAAAGGTGGGAPAGGEAGGAGATPLGEGRFDPPLSPAARDGGRAAHLRLTAQAWEVIRGERLAGAAVAELAARWEVSQGAIRRHARDEGWSNTDRGEAVSRAMVEGKIAERAFAQGRAAAEGEAAAADAAGAALEAERDPADAAGTLVRRAAARSLAGRLDEAQALLKTAEALRRAAQASSPPQDAFEDDPPAGGSAQSDDALLELRLRNLARNLGIEREPAPEAPVSAFGEAVGGVEGAHGEFGVGGLDQHADLDLRGGDDLDVDAALGQGAEHGLGHARV